MIKSFMKDSLIYTINSFLSKGISVLLIPLYTKRLTPADYGTIDIFMIITSFVNVTVCFEITQAIARYYPQITAHDRKRTFASTALWFTLGCYAVFLTFAYLLGVPFNRLITGQPNMLPLYFLALLTTCTTGIFYFFQEQLKWSFKSRQYSIVSICYTLITFASSAAMILIWDMGVYGYFYGILIGSVTGTSLAYLHEHQLFRLSFDRKTLSIMMRFSVPLVFSSISIMLSMYIDRIMIKSFLTLNDLGLFGVAYRFASVVGLLMTGIQAALVPLVYKHYAEEEARRQIAKIFNTFVLLAAALVLLITLFAKETILLFTHPDYYACWPFIPLIALTNIFSLMYIFTPGLTIFKKTRQLATINFSGAIVNLVLNLFLVPAWGLYGVVLSTFISYLLIFFVNLYYSQQHVNIPYNFNAVRKVVLLIVPLVLIFLTLEYFIGHFAYQLNWMLIFVKIGLVLLYGIATANIPYYKELYIRLYRNIINKHINS